MRERVQLTLLQRAVLQRLREGGCDALADMARDAWRRGAPLPIREPAESIPSTLITDFARANGQARERLED